MFKRIRIMTLPLALAAILIVLVFTGCGGGTAEPEGTEGQLNKQELEEVISDTLLSLENADTYQFSLDMNIDVEVIGGSEEGTMEISMRADGALDIPDEEMQMDLDMSMEGDIEGLEGGSQQFSAEMYLVDEWLYMKMKVSGLGEQWVKTPATEDIKEAYNLDIVNQQLAPLESMVEIQFIKYESVDGSQCYVLKIVPDLESMKGWLNEQQMTAGTAEWDELVSDMFKELDYRVWVATDTKLMKKMTMSMKVEMNAEQVGASSADFDVMLMEMELEMTMKNYNKPVSIDLPDEAENAMEM